MNIYNGPLNPTKMDDLARSGYYSWRDQRNRCYSPRHPSYKNYGAKGIRVEYSAREFIGWWIHNKSQKSWRIATVGRLDHSKNYCFENIEMQEKSDNAKEVHERLYKNNPIRSMKCISINGDEIKEFDSQKAASEHFGVSRALVNLICNEQRSKTRNGVIFRRSP